MQSKAVSGLDWILENFPFFHKSMYSAAHCSADSSKSHNPLRLVCFALFEKYLWKPDISHDIWPDINTSKSDGSVAILPFVYT